MGLIKDVGNAAERERAVAMPSPVTTARRGIIVGRSMGLDKHQAALMVMVAARAATASVIMDGCDDTRWLDAIHAEASRIYDRSAPRPAP